MTADRAATVWSATHIPGACPLPGLSDDGYSVAWVDVSGSREQVVVRGPLPSPGTSGRLIATPIDGVDVDVFVADPA